MNNRDDYFALTAEHPELFVNPPGPSITILLDENEIQQAEAVVAERLAQRGLPAEWARVGIAYQDQYLRIVRDAVRFPDGSLGTYIRVVPPTSGAPGVVMLAVCGGNVVLTRHFRHGSRTWHWETPRGFGEEGSSSEDNARRELEEEIRATGIRLTSMGFVSMDTDSSGPPDELFFAEIESYGRPETAEGIAELRMVSQSEFQRMIRESEITDGYTHVAYAKAKSLGLL